MARLLGEKVIYFLHSFIKVGTLQIWYSPQVLLSTDAPFEVRTCDIACANLNHAMLPIPA